MGTRVCDLSDRHRWHCGGRYPARSARGRREARETVLPILLLPVLAQVLVGATRAFDDALGSVAVDGWSWLDLLAGFGVINVVLGALAYGVLLEET